MIGFLIVTHGDLCRALLQSVAQITGPQVGIEAITIEQKDDMPTAARRIEKAFERIYGSDGAIIFTDLLGGTPSNVSLTFLGKPNVEVISGVNMPMLLKAVTSREGALLAELASECCATGRSGIVAATDILRGKVG
jgi:PTS system mannose-specific IIA component